MKKPVDELLMAAAGPATSLLLGIILGIIALTTPAASFVGSIARVLAVMNLGLALFNMIPGFPLDGGRVLRAAIWGVSQNMRLATRVASVIGRAIATFMIVGGLLWAVLTGDWSTGIWFAFIGWFLENAASQSYAQFVLREMLAGITARDIMNEACPTMAEDPNLQTLIDQQVLGEGRRCLLLTREDALAGMVTLHNIKRVPREQWITTLASEVMTPVDELRTVDIDDSALDVLRKMDVEDVNQIPVMDAGRLVGLISRENIVRVIRQQAESSL
jgi:predicted transcriptional regulator